jgi:hypothetical protein
MADQLVLLKYEQKENKVINHVLYIGKLSYFNPV